MKNLSFVLYVVAIVGCGDNSNPGVDAAGMTDAADMGPPRVLSVTPADGEDSVSAQVNIVVTFSKPMNKVATQAAYQSPDIPPGQVVFSWNETGTELTVDPASDLEYATGADPQTLTARAYAYFISTVAEDLSGNALDQQTNVTFYTLRHVVDQTLAAPDSSLSSSWRSDNTIGTGDCLTQYCVGDSQSAPNRYYVVGLTFDLTRLAPGAVLESATLSSAQNTVSGNPLANLGTLNLEQVSYSVVDAVSQDGLFVAPALASGNPVGVFSTSATPGDRSMNVATQVEASRNQGDSVVQFRLKWTHDSNFDGISDVFTYLPGTTQLTLSYLAP